jgi:serine/threonine protein kinase/Flp pilus assembly protein TadD
MLRKGLGGEVESGGSSFEEAFEPTTPDQAKQRFEHYRLVTGEDGKPVELGRGAMGVTYKAFDVDLRYPVALKVINERYLGDKSARLRFLREARAAASVRHPNVASVFHLGRTGQNYFYAMEFVAGETLASLIKRSGRLEVKLALEIAAQVAAGLIAVDKQKLVHRDIKPGNVMVSLEDQGAVTAKLIDLGLAKAVSEPLSEAAISMAGAFAGTPEFASPEQFAGVGVDIRSDLYSLGVTLWETLTGQAPFRGSPAELMSQHQRAPLPLEQAKEVPQPVVVLLQVLLEKDPARRLQSPAQLLKAIQKVTDAVKARHSITLQSLRAIDGQPLSRRQQLIEDLNRLRLAMAGSRRRLVLWLGFVLIAGGFLLVVFLGSNRRASDTSISPLNVSKAPEKSIAVLPFESLSDNQNDIYFADGVQDEILNNLAKIAQLKVISRTSVMQYRGNGKRDLRQIAAALGVANVLEGTVRRDGDTVRISTELIDAGDDHTVWADSYDRDLTHIFAIQSEIAQIVASKLSAQLSPDERKNIEEKPTNNLEAYDLYLQAKQLTAGVSAISLPSTERNDLSEAIKLLTAATQKDPHFALGYCLMAKAHDILYSDLLDHSPERIALGDAAVNEALRLRPDLPEAHLAAAFHRYACYQDFERARVQIAIAAQSLSNSPDLLELLAMIDQVQGQWEDATTRLEKAVGLDPRNPEILEMLADHYSNLRRFRDSNRIRDRLIEMEPDQPLFSLNRADAAFCEKGDLKSVRAIYDALPSSMKDDDRIRNQRSYYAMCDRDFKTAHEIVDQSPNQEIFMSFVAVPRRCADIWLEMVQGNHPTMEEFRITREQLSQKIEADPTNALLLSVGASVDIALGRKEEAISEAKRAIEILPISKDAMVGPLLVKHLAIIYAWANERDLAFEQINILLKIPNNSFLNYGDLKFDPGWDPLRNDPRFDKILAEVASPI